MPAACARLRERYDVVLVDEFQDTDPVQWDIMHRAFGQGGATLVLIGDPKQAIYAFRGADVHAYLQARDVVQSEWTLDVNWRSDQGLLDAYDALFDDAQLGYAGITYRKIRAADANRDPGWSGRRTRRRCVSGSSHAARRPRPADGRRQAAQGARGAGASSPGTWRRRSSRCFRPARRSSRGRRDGAELERTTLHPGHIAVLVRTNSHAVTVRDALHAAGVPAVIGGSGSVFATEPALEWLRLLEALERPTARDRASLAALTCFIGWTPEEVATAGRRVGGTALVAAPVGRLLRDQGIASLYETVSSSHEVPERVLARPVGRALHDGSAPRRAAAARGGRVRGARARPRWPPGSAGASTTPTRDAENEERARRLESDAEAVQVITIHRSKGLEFPVVFCPFMWDGRPYKQRGAGVPRSRERQRAHHRRRARRQRFAVHQQIELEEGRGEDLRLLYVALTRARHQAVLWWAGAMDSQHSPLARLLFDRDDEGVVGPYGARAPHRRRRRGGRRGHWDPAVAVERVGRPSNGRWQ